MVICSSGDDRLVNTGETCTTICNIGYEVQTGDVIRTCGSDRMFNGTDVVCSRGNNV